MAALAGPVLPSEDDSDGSSPGSRQPHVSLMEDLMASYHRDDVLKAFETTGGELKDETLEKLDELDLQRKGLSAEPEPEPESSRSSSSSSSSSSRRSAAAARGDGQFILDKYMDTLTGGKKVTKPGVVLLPPKTKMSVEVIRQINDLYEETETVRGEEFGFNTYNSKGDLLRKDGLDENFWQDIANWSPPPSFPAKAKPRFGPIVLKDTVQPLRGEPCIQAEYGRRGGNRPRFVASKEEVVRLYKGDYEKLKFFFSGDVGGWGLFSGSLKTKTTPYTLYAFNRHQVSHLFVDAGATQPVAIDIPENTENPTMIAWVLDAAVNDNYKGARRRARRTGRRKPRRPRRPRSPSPRSPRKKRRTRKKPKRKQKITKRKPKGKSK